MQANGLLLASGGGVSRIPRHLDYTVPAMLRLSDGGKGRRGLLTVGLHYGTLRSAAVQVDALSEYVLPRKVRGLVGSTAGQPDKSLR